MMTEFEDHGEEEQRLLLRHLDGAKPQPRATNPPKPSRFWHLIGRLYLAYLRWRYRIRPQ